MNSQNGSALATIDTATGEVLTASAAANFMPVLQLDDVVTRRALLARFRDDVLTKDTDYGVIPGTGKKPTLLKPGAEKLCTLFGLSVSFEFVDRVEDWSGADHGGEPFFYYLVRCHLSRGGYAIASADGSANSWETKYRYRQEERKCPVCDGAFIIKGREEYGGGWVCFKKKGGCGAKFRDGDAAIEGQQTGRVANPDVADQVNTLQKMAEKRALVAAALIAVNASEYFTQDVEDTQQHEPEGVTYEAVPEPELAAAPATELADEALCSEYLALAETADGVGIKTKVLPDNASVALVRKWIAALEAKIEARAIETQEQA